MTDTVTALVLAGLVGIVLSALFFFAMLRRRTRAAFEDGLQRQAERANADHQLLEEDSMRKAARTFVSTRR